MTTDHAPSSLRVRIRDLTRRRIQKFGRRHWLIFDRIIRWSGIATFGKVERQLRRKLGVAPDVVQFSIAPCGQPISPPIVMTTSEGMDAIAASIYHRGWSGFEDPLPRLFQAVLTDWVAGRFLDIGANNGVYSLLSKALAPQREVLAFEPFAPALKLLKRNIGMNAFANDIEVIPAAVSDTDGFAQLFIPTQEHGLVETSASLDPTFKDQHSAVNHVTTTTIDNYLARKPRGHIAIMKIDTEAAELKVIRGAVNTILQDHPIIICEVLLPCVSASLILDLLSALNYKKIALRQTGLVSLPSDRFDSGSTNYLFYFENHLPLVKRIANIAGLDFKE